ncbi:MAG: glycosyltransferase family 39 protein, partial [Anaerolineaceae bacterium]
TFPFNAELVSYWTLLFTRTENLMGMLGFLSGYLSIVLVFQLARSLVKKPVFALIAALTWAAFPVVQLNLTSTRHDHVSSLLLLAAIYFFYSHIVNKNRSYLILTGLSLGISIGTNYSVAGYLPGLGLSVLICWLVLKKVDIRDLAIVTSALVLAFVLFSSPVFISNQIHFGSPLGPKALEMTSQASADVGLPEHVALMTGRWTYQLVDLQQFPEPILSRLMSAKAWLSQKITNITGLSLEKNSALLNEHEFGYTKQVPFSEDSAWYGLTGIFVFFAVSIYVIVQAIKLRHPLLIVGGALWFTAPISFALLRSGWTPYDGRYFIPLFAMLSLGLAVMLENLKPLFAKMLIWTLVTLSGVTLLLSIYGNPAKSFWGYRAFWQLFRLDAISAQSQHTKDMIYLVDQTIPLDGRLGVATTDSVYYEYGMYGDHFTRTIIPVHPPYRLCDADWLDSQGIEYLLVDYGDPEYPTCSLGNYETLKSMSDWMSYKR